MIYVALFTRAWIEMYPYKIIIICFIKSPSSRGRGLKYEYRKMVEKDEWVALFTRAWIEIFALYYIHPAAFVALFTRAWIEIYC